jgi:signal transduction histidine kinase
VAEEVSREAITANDTHQGNVILYRLAGIGLGGLLIVILSTFLLLRFGARISRELTGLRNAAQVLSGERLPSVVRRLRAGDEVDVEAEAPPLELRTRTREVTETADAFSAVQHTAIEAAVEQATLRKGVSNVFRSLARRNQSLVQRQLRMLDEMERATQDPDALAQLFRLDHLTTRMRRQAEGLIILSGSAPSRRWRQPVAVVEVLRGAISEIEDYVRVDLITDSPDYLTGAAVADVTHLLAEVIENAVVYSPPATRIAVRGGRVANGYVIEVEDRGLGIPPAARDVLNDRLAQPPDFDLTDSDQLGLFVVSRLAIRNEIKVSLRESGFGGTTAIVLLPGALVVTEDEAKALAAQGPQGPQGPRALGGANRPTEADGTGPGRRVPRLDRPVAAAHDDHDMGDAFARGPSGTQAHGGGTAGYGQYGAGGPDGDPSFGGGPAPARGGAPFSGDSFASRSSSGGPGFGASPGFGGGLPSESGSFGGATLPSRGGPPSGPFGRSDDSGSFPSAGVPGRGGLAAGGSPAEAGSLGGGTSFGGGTLPPRGGTERGAFGNPAPFQDAPAAGGSHPAAGGSHPAAGGSHPAGDGGGQNEGVSSIGLPKRQKMASLAPQLRDIRPEAPKGSLAGRSPEQARALLSSIQRGLRTGRDSGAAGDPAAGSGGQAGPGYPSGPGDGTEGTNAR